MVICTRYHREATEVTHTRNMFQENKKINYVARCVSSVRLVKGMSRPSLPLSLLGVLPVIAGLLYRCYCCNSIITTPPCRCVLCAREWERACVCVRARACIWSRAWACAREYACVCVCVVCSPPMYPVCMHVKRRVCVDECAFSFAGPLVRFARNARFGVIAHSHNWKQLTERNWSAQKFPNKISISKEEDLWESRLGDTRGQYQFTRHRWPRWHFFYNTDYSTIGGFDRPNHRE